MKPRNLLFIMSDEHNRRVMGCSGHGVIRTPNMDRLAARGVRFTDAYCNSPICVPSRASFATGRYVNQIRFWDNAIPYDGSIPSWGHRLQQAGSQAVSVGKLHFRSADDNNGFTEEIIPLHVVNGVGDVLGLLRDDLPVRAAALKLATDAGPGDSSYQGYDDRITEAAQAWLRGRARAAEGRPWVLFVSFVCPHFPLIARDRWYDMYPHHRIPWPPTYDPADRPDHPYIAAIRACMFYDKAFDEPTVRRATAAYFGLVSFLDDNIGKLLRTLEESGLTENTRVIYTSDHGDNLGARGLWGKSTMYDDSAGVPLIMAGPELPEGWVCKEPVSLVDGFPTILDCVGAAPHPDDADLPGCSLFQILRAPPRRTVMSEYHAAGAATGAFMIRKEKFKYVHYVGMPPQLFDLENDPQEVHDLGRDPAWQGLVATCEAALRRVVDPEAVNARAFADQRALIEHYGGRAAVMKGGSFAFSPVPGDKPSYA